jgi:hypothetical protein
MIDPMVARLAGCLVFGGLLVALIGAADASADRRKQSEKVAQVEIQQRVEQRVALTRP